MRMEFWADAILCSIEVHCLGSVRMKLKASQYPFTYWSRELGSEPFDKVRNPVT